MQSLSHTLHVDPAHRISVVFLTVYNKASYLVPGDSRLGASGDLEGEPSGLTRRHHTTTGLCNKLRGALTPNTGTVFYLGDPKWASAKRTMEQLGVTYPQMGTK